MFTVWIKRTWGFFRFWKKIKNVTGDTYFFTEGGTLPIRVFMLQGNIRMEIPSERFMIKFSPEREVIVNQQKAEQQKQMEENYARSQKIKVKRSH